MIVDIDELVHETKEAFLVRIDTKNFWLPKSQAEIIEETPRTPLAVALPEWLAEKKGLI